MKKILVACGNGVATSTLVGKAIKETCEEAGIPVSITQCKLLEVESKAENFDLVVTTGTFSGDVNVPVVSGIAFLTGVNKEQTMQEILDHLKQE